MHLITMAHLGEAQGVIQNFKLKKIEMNLYQNEDMILLVTGEGPFEAATHTALILGRFQFSKVINLGIAGALKKDLKLGEIYPVRTIYLFNEERPAFKTFSAFEGQGVDCLTSFERILDPVKAQNLRGLAHLVDREAWGVAYASKAQGIPFSSYKLISDIAGTIGACELIKEEAEGMAQKLSSYLEVLLKIKNETDSDAISLPGFHFTFTTQHQLKNLLTKLSIKNELTIEEILESSPLYQLREEEILPKERASLLLKYFEGQLDPLKRTLQLKKNEWLGPMKNTGIDVLTDPQWETSKVTIRFDINSDEELSQKLDSLKDFSLAPLKELMEGNVDVE